MKPIIFLQMVIFSLFLFYGTGNCGDCKYTVDEIDALRAVIEYRYIWGTSLPISGEGSYMSRVYKEVDMSKIVEGQVRTYMEGCIKAEDIINSDKEKRK